MGVPRVARAAGAAGLGLLGTLAVATEARSEPRPTEGGLWSFDAGDVVESWEEPSGLVRVHYSTAGPNATRLEDGDGDLVPDYPQLVALTVVDALAFFTGDQGFRPPLPETAVGGPLGGSEALDVYLVDFGGAADGRFGLDACEPATGRCAGFLVIENDFAGYGYASLEQATSVVGSHELFHAVQAAYADLPIWMSEGTATWATYRYDDTTPDFVGACAGYLADPGRPLYEPPPGPVPSFAYGTALWFEFITARDGDDLVDAMLVALDDDDGASAPQDLMERAMEDAGDALADSWPVFARHNLAAGFRAGVATSHPYAAQLQPVDADAEGPTLDLSVRLFPLATEYWRIDHGGGALVFGADEPLDDVVFSLHPVGDFESDGVVGDALSEWDAEDAGSRVVFEPDLPAGGYWIVAARAAIAEGSARARVCVGSAEHVAGCELDPIPEGEDTGSVDESGTDSGEPGGIGTTGGGDDTTTDPPSGTDPGDPGCGCRSAPGEGPAWLPLALVVLLRRRRHGVR